MDDIYFSFLYARLSTIEEYDFATNDRKSMLRSCVQGKQVIKSLKNFS